MISKPCGVCIQLLEARIQKVEISVPIATITVEKKCKPRPTLFQPNSITPEETGFEEECREHFIGQQRPGDGAGEVREAAPVGAELIGHDQPGDHAHAEVDGKDLRPEMVKVTVGVVMGFQPQAFEHRKVTRQTDGDGREQDVERDGERELNSGEIECL